MAAKGFVFRVRIILAGVFLFAAILLLRLYFIQVVHGEAFSEEANRQYVRTEHNAFDRGFIFFEDEDNEPFRAAMLKSGFILAIQPDEVVREEETYAALSEIMPLDRDMFFLRAGKKNDPYEELARRVPPGTAAKIEALELPGVNLYPEKWRYYPGDALAAQTIGFIAYDGDVLEGRYGLERYYEDVLSRKGNALYVNFFAEIFSNVKTAFPGGRRGSGDVMTSIYLSIQLELEKEVKAIRKEWSAKRAGGIVLDPETGFVKGMAMAPSFDLNHFGREENALAYSNPLVENIHELGSIVKPLTIAAALDSGAVTAKTTYHDTGFVTLDGATISNFDGEGRGIVPLQEVLNQSLNTGAVYVMERMGTEQFAEYMDAFGLSEETGIDLPNEAAPLVANLDSPRTIEYATASFGQGIAVTPVAMMRTLSALAHGGKTVNPRIVREIRTISGLPRKGLPLQEARALSPEAAEEITRMLVEVVDDALLDGTVKREAYSIAAKTGTAQIARENERGYYDDRFLHSFFGYFPAFDPEYLVFLYVEEPVGARYASETLTHPFMDLTSFLINHAEIPPDR